MNEETLKTIAFHLMYSQYLSVKTINPEQAKKIWYLMFIIPDQTPENVVVIMDQASEIANTVLNQ